MRRSLLIAATGVLGALALAPSAHALTKMPVWQCRGSAVYASIAGQNRLEPIAANGNINTADGSSPDRAQCAPARPALATQPLNWASRRASWGP